MACRECVIFDEELGNKAYNFYSFVAQTKDPVRIYKRLSLESDWSKIKVFMAMCGPVMVFVVLGFEASCLVGLHQHSTGYVAFILRAEDQEDRNISSEI
jgi:hypothetical protein